MIASQNMVDVLWTPPMTLYTAKKLADILDELLDYYGGFEGLSRKIEIRCFCIDPSVKSSLRFLRTTPWAREKVESLYLYVLRQKAKQKS